MKHLVFFFSIFLFTACQKDDVKTPEAPLVAQTFLNVSYGTDVQQKMDVYLPAGRSADSTKLIVLIHGGAWIEGDKSDFDTFVTALKQRLPGYAIANINYRLATLTANHFPAQEQDMKAAVDYLIQQADEYNISEKIVLLGASAGGHMAALQAYKQSVPKVKALVDFFGPVDMVATYNSITDPTSLFAIQILMSGTPTSNSTLYQQSSPINFVTAQSPPTIIFHGGQDDLVDVAQSIALKDKLQSAGVTNQLVIYPAEGHGIWPTPVMTDAFAKLEAFLKTNVQ